MKTIQVSLNKSPFIDMSIDFETLNDKYEFFEILSNNVFGKPLFEFEYTIKFNDSFEISGLFSTYESEVDRILEHDYINLLYAIYPNLKTFRYNNYCPIQIKSFE